MKIVNEYTLEIEDVNSNDKAGAADAQAEDRMLTIITEAFDGCSPEVLEAAYTKYKQAEEEFNKLYEPIKNNIINLHESVEDLPKRILIGDMQMTYVSPSTRTIVDTKKLKEEEPDIAKKFTKTSTVKATIRLESQYPKISKEE